MPRAKKVQESEVFISVKEASLKTGYTTGAIYRMVQAKAIQFNKDENGTFVSLNDIRKKMEKNKNYIVKKPRIKKAVEVKEEISEEVFEGVPTNILVNVLIAIIGVLAGYILSTLLR